MIFKKSVTFFFVFCRFYFSFFVNKKFHCFYVVDSQLLTIDLVQQLDSLIAPDVDRIEWSLLFRATRDGFNRSIFHQLCNNKGPTITVARVKNGPLVGGYTKVSWSSSIGVKYDITAFVFNNLHNDQITKFQ